MNKIFRFVAAPVAATLAMVGAAHAALPAEATAAMTDMASDAKLLAGAFLVVCIVIGAIKVLKKGAN